MLVVVIAASVMDLLDATVVNVAAPAVSAELGGGTAVIAWLAAAYTLAFGVLLVIGGRLGDRWGRRRLFLLGSIGFTACSLLCGLAPTAVVLIAARVLQGGCAALLIPQGLGLLKAVFTPEQTGRAFAAFAPAMALASVGGPLLGGALIELNLLGSGWRSIFLINLPIGVLIVAGAWRWLPADRSNRSVRLDGLGAGLLALACLLTIYPLIQGARSGWPGWAVGALAGAGVVFAAFGVRQRHASQPLITPSLFAKRAFTTGMCFGLVFFAVVAGVLLVLSLFVQTQLGYSPLAAGLTGAPISVGIVIASFAGRHAPARLARRLVGAGALGTAAGTALFAAVIYQLGEHTTAVALLLPGLVVGLGMGGVFAPLYNLILGAVEHHEVGSAAGALPAVQQLASALGVAALTTIYSGIAATGDGVWAMTSACLGATALALLAAALVTRFPAPAQPQGTQP